MLYHLFSQFEDAFSGVRLIQYITFRATFAAIFAFIVATWVGPGIVASLRKRKIAGYTKTGSDEVDSQRDAKKDVPTMGGVILLIGVALSGFLFARLDNPYTWVVLLGFLAFGALGAVDDWRKLTDSQSRGISEKQKLGGQLVISLLAIGTLYGYREMKEQGHGLIVNVASQGGVMPVGTMAAYSGTKHAVVGLTASVAGEAEAFGVEFKTVCPGNVASDAILSVRWRKFQASKFNSLG